MFFIYPLTFVDISPIDYYHRRRFHHRLPFCNIVTSWEQTCASAVSYRAYMDLLARDRSLCRLD